jgi:hypothetical protein
MPLLMAAVVMSGTSAQGPTSQPLITASDLTYLGGFAMPKGTYGTAPFTYGGQGLTFYKDSSGRATLYLAGRTQNPGHVAQVQIPSSVVKSSTWSSLPVATVLQNFVSVPNSPDPASCEGNDSNIYGLLPYGGRLIVAAACSYGGTQPTTHGARSLTLSQSGFVGFTGFTGAIAPPRALAGPMTHIPAEWQSSFGGPVMGGLCCISVIDTSSYGPALTVFDPNDIGAKNAITGKTVLWYDSAHTASGGKNSEASQNDVFNLTSRVGGVAFIPGTRSVLFVEGHGTGPYCYGTYQECGNDTALKEVKGPHAQPYRYQILAYDANDLLAVKNGTKNVYDPKPYAVIVLDGMPHSYNPYSMGATYDPETRRLYLTQDYGENPRVEVWQVRAPSATTTTPPAPPSNVRIIK